MSPPPPRGGEAGEELDTPAARIMGRRESRAARLAMEEAPLRGALHAPLRGPRTAADSGGEGECSRARRALMDGVVVAWQHVESVLGFDVRDGHGRLKNNWFTREPRPPDMLVNVVVDVPDAPSIAPRWGVRCVATHGGTIVAAGGDDGVVHVWTLAERGKHGWAAGAVARGIVVVRSIGAERDSSDDRKSGSSVVSRQV